MNESKSPERVNFNEKVGCSMDIGPIKFGSYPFGLRHLSNHESATEDVTLYHFKQVFIHMLGSDPG